MGEIKRVSEVFGIPKKLPEKLNEEDQSEADEDSIDENNQLIKEDGQIKLAEHNQAAAMKQVELDRKLEQFKNNKKESP